MIVSIAWRTLAVTWLFWTCVAKRLDQASSVAARGLY